jgi:transcriptional regulator with XRE-family HTH domain
MAMMKHQQARVGRERAVARLNSTPPAEARMGKRRQDPRDAAIGKRVRTLRLQRGMSQMVLADHLELTFQQVQKYENGTNRISAGRLQRISEVLAVPVMFFYAGFQENQGKRASNPVGVEFDFLQTEDAIRLMRAYARIRSRGTQLKLVRLTETLADESTAA